MLGYTEPKIKLLKWGRFCTFPLDIWQYLQTSLVVKIGEGV